jgi:hypothetical protein
MRQPAIPAARSTGACAEQSSAGTASLAAGAFAVVAAVTGTTAVAGALVLILLALVIDARH